MKKLNLLVSSVIALGVATVVFNQVSANEKKDTRTPSSQARQKKQAQQKEAGRIPSVNELNNTYWEVTITESKNAEGIIEGTVKMDNGWLQVGETQIPTYHGFKFSFPKENKGLLSSFSNSTAEDAPYQTIEVVVYNAKKGEFVSINRTCEFDKILKNCVNKGYVTSQIRKFSDGHLEVVVKLQHGDYFLYLEPITKNQLNELHKKLLPEMKKYQEARTKELLQSSEDENGEEKK